jgi:hypothetical protein
LNPEDNFLFRTGFNEWKNPKGFSTLFLFSDIIRRSDEKTDFDHIDSRASAHCFPQSMTLKAKDSPTQTDIESIIREQIEAFAKSIDQKDADTKASRALANHGVSGGGKKLSVGKNHALTATLMNSNWFQEVLTNSCIKMIETRQIIGQSRVYGRGSCNWTEDKSSYHCSIFDYDFDMNIYKAIIVAANGDLHKTDYCALVKNTLSTESRNAYDSSLFMIVGKVFFSIDL